jgi:hypothetical protein
MTKTEIEEYLLELEYKLLIKAERHSIELTPHMGQFFSCRSSSLSVSGRW